MARVVERAADGAHALLHRHEQVVRAEDRQQRAVQCSQRRGGVVVRDARDERDGLGCRPGERRIPGSAVPLRLRGVHARRVVADWTRRIWSRSRRSACWMSAPLKPSAASWWRSRYSSWARTLTPGPDTVTTAAIPSSAAAAR
ncbi:hypothetical protein V2I01_05370 [Micromonospora sp. BRA006-A]|nr:hypothetical protein [Micromonospora sp. BRA006-A]